MATTPVDEQHVVNTLATVLHIAGGGTLGSPSTTTPDSAHQLGQNYLDQATNQATPTAPTATSTTLPTSLAGDSTTVDPVPEGTPVTQPYGGGSGHPGIDLGVPVGTQLLAAASGTVTVASNSDPGGYGNEVEIALSDGSHIRYGHLSTIGVHVGDTVKAGQVIGNSGGDPSDPNHGNSDGAHLHFEVRGPDGNTVDPTPYLAGGHAIVSADPGQVTITPPSLDTKVGAAASNILDVAAGKQATHQAQSTSTKTPGVSTGVASKGDGDPASVDAFLAATRQHESGGNYTIRNQSGLSNAAGAYQFIGSTWRGLGGSTESAADASPEEQDRIARAYALQLFNQFHSWRLVAIAWYGGPGIAQQVANGQDPGAPDQQGGYLAYGDTIASMMGGGK